MAERHVKKFDFRKKPEREVSFELEGVDHRGRPHTYEFRCLSAISATAVSEFYRLKEEVEHPASALLAFIEAMLVEEDVAKWRRVMEDRRLNITTDELLQIWSWLQEQYTDRPTEPPSGSANGRTTTDTGSEASSSLQAVE